VKGVILVTGKGGVGKTTFSSILSIALSTMGKDVLAVSIDPAHHLGDVFGTEIGDEEKVLAERLKAREADADALVASYLSKYTELMGRLYKSANVLNIDKYFETLKYAPGIEDEALFDFLMSLFKREEEAIIVDTPPSGPTLRILNIPWVEEVWLEQLIDMRSKIAGLKEAIESVKAGKKVKIDDRILLELVKMREEVQEEIRNLTDPSRFSVYAVTTPEKLPILDLKRLVPELKRRKIAVKGIVVNRFKSEDSTLQQLKEEFPETPIFLIPHLSEQELIGMENIKKLIDKVRVVQ